MHDNLMTVQLKNNKKRKGASMSVKISEELFWIADSV